MKILWILVLTSILCSSHAKDRTIIAPTETNTDTKLIHTSTINNEWEHTYHYNEDNSLNKIVFRVDGDVQYTETFKYEDGKIVESVKTDLNKDLTVKKQYAYKNNLIVKTKLYTNDELSETISYKYNRDNFMKEINAKATTNGYTSTKITFIEKLENENKIIVSREGVATHIISYDERLKPQCEIPGYKAIVQLDYNGISGNILLTEIYTNDECSSTISVDIEFDEDQKTILKSKTTFDHSGKILGVHDCEYDYQ